MAEDKISYFNIQSRLKSIIKNQKTLAGEEDVKTSSLAKFKLDTSVFNWEKYAQALTSKKGEGAEANAIQEFDGSEEEQAFLEVLNAVYENEEVFKGTDSNSDGILSANELETYFEGLSGFDKDSGTLSLKDFAKFFQNKEISFEDTLETSNEAVKEAKEAEAAAAAGASGGGYSPGGGSYIPKNKDTGKDEAKPVEKVDPKTLDYVGSVNYVSKSTANTLDIAEMNSKSLSSAENNPLLNMSTISLEDRQKLIDAANAKETAAGEVETAKTALGDTDTANVDAIEAYQTAVETKALAQEAVNNTKAQQEACNIQIQNIESRVTTIDGNIATLEGKLNQISVDESGTEEEVAKARAKAEAERNAIREQIASLQSEKASLEAQKGQLDAQKANLDTQLGTQEEALTAAETSETETKAKVDELQATMTQEEQVYMNSVTKLQEASNKYNEVKNEIMTKSNAEAKETYNSLETKAKAEEGKSLYTFSIPNQNDLKVKSVFEELHGVKDGKEPTSPEAKAALEKYNKLSDEDKAKLIKLYGSEDKLMSVLAYTQCVGKTSTGLTTDTLLNANNYADTYETIKDLTIENRNEIIGKMNELLAK